jgi:hypothetical protein
MHEDQVYDPDDQGAENKATNDPPHKTTSTTHCCCADEMPKPPTQCDEADK